MTLSSQQYYDIFNQSYPFQPLLELFIQWIKIHPKIPLPPFSPQNIKRYPDRKKYFAIEAMIATHSLFHDRIIPRSCLKALVNLNALCREVVNTSIHHHAIWVDKWLTHQTHEWLPHAMSFLNFEQKHNRCTLLIHDKTQLLTQRWHQAMTQASYQCIQTWLKACPNNQKHYVALHEQINTLIITKQIVNLCQLSLKHNDDRLFVLLCQSSKRHSYQLNDWHNAYLIMAATKRRARIHQILLRQVMISSTPQALDPLPKKDTYQSSQTFSQLNIDLYDLDNIQTDVCFDGLNNSYTLRHNQIIDHFHHVNCHQYLSPKGAQTIHDLMQQKSLILHHLIKEQLNSSPTKVHLLSVPIDLHQHDTFINCHCMLPLFAYSTSKHHHWVHRHDTQQWQSICEKDLILLKWHIHSIVKEVLKCAILVT